MNVETYDFRKPARLASDLEQRLAIWLQAKAARWLRHCGSSSYSVQSWS